MTCLSVGAAATTGSHAGEGRAARVRVHVVAAPIPEGEHGAVAVRWALQQFPLFRIVADPSEAEIILQPTAHIPETPPGLQTREGQPPRAQPCHVMLSHTSFVMLAGSISAQAPTCREAARKALRGLAVQLLERPYSRDGSI